MSSPNTTELQVEGMTCNNCARHVTEAIQSVPDVRSAMVSLKHHRATVRWASETARSIPSVLKAIASAGYEASELTGADGAGEVTGAKPWPGTLIIGVVVTLVLMAGEWVLGLESKPWFMWLSFALAGLVQIVCGAQFYAGAWRQIKVGQSNMDTLVALGSSTAFGYSSWALCSGTGGHLYFMEAAAIISLISLGHWVEARVSDQAGGTLKALLNLAPQTARKLTTPVPAPVQTKPFVLQSPAAPMATPNSPVPTEEVLAKNLVAGDCVLLRPGDRVPVDGVVVEGKSAVDEAMLTGESAPVDKDSGNNVFAGTVNLNGRLIMRVTATGEDTALAHIVAAVQRAQTSRAAIQRLGDRISSVFVPVIVMVALGSGLIWGLAPGAAHHVHEVLARFLWHSHPPVGIAAGFIIASAVLIVACPCAMGLATPAAIMAGANAAARRGILIRDGVALEKAGRITAVVFDKTGTLTEGKPRMAASNYFPLQPADGLEVAKTEGFVASLAALSSHPLSRAMAAANPTRHAVADFKELSGRGISGVVGDEAGPEQLLKLGSFRWLSEVDVDCNPAAAFSEEWMARGATVIGFALNGRLAAAYALRDGIRAEAVKVIDQLQDPTQGRGLKIFMVSGDSTPTVNAIAAELGIAFWESGEDTEPRAFAEMRPDEKAAFVKKLQAQGDRVAFVGDGINDAPALAQADLGIAVTRASDIAREAADIVLLNAELEAVSEAIGLARATLRTIKQNLFWAFFYNALAVPLAALGFISPVICAAAMGFSDLIVIGNALRLLRWRQK